MRGPGSYRDSQVAQGMGRGQVGKKVEDLVGSDNTKLRLRCQHPPTPTLHVPQGTDSKGDGEGQLGGGGALLLNEVDAHGGHS